MSLTSVPAAIDVAVVATGLGATLLDARSRRIPNALTLGSTVAAVVFHAFDAGATRALPGAVAWSVSGWIVGLLLFLPVFALGGLGAGDVKLLGAFGAWLGPAAVCWVAVYGAIAGGLLAVVWLVARRSLGRTMSNLWGLIGFWRAAGIRPHPGLTLDAPAALRMPYALPLAIGAVIAMWWAP